MIFVNFKLKLVILFILADILSYKLKSQNSTKYNDRLLTIAKDSIWIKKSIWKESRRAYSLVYNTKDSSQYINPIFKIKDNNDAEKFDLVVIPHYKIPKCKVDSIFTNNLIEIIEIDTSEFWALVKYENEVVGVLSINYYKKKMKWIGNLEIYNGTGPIKVAYSEIQKFDPDFVFTIAVLDGMWFIKDHLIKVYSFYTKEITDYLEHIKENYTTQSIKDRYIYDY